MIATYLIQYGRPGFVGRFRGPDPAVALTRGDRVAIRGPRGLELGTVLCEPADRFSEPAVVDGEVVGRATPEDAAAADRATALGQAILAAAEAAATEASLPLVFVDVETPLDGVSVVLHAVPWAECDATLLFSELSARFERPVRLLDLSRPTAAPDPPEPATAGCGKPGCGSEGGGCTSCGTGGGCSTGSCSRGKVTSAADLTAYFADLRQKMEEQGANRTPLS
jgi:hypothetical protein